MKIIALLVLLVPALAMPLAAAWETVRHKGHDYVTARSIKNFYAFETMEKKGQFLELENDAVKMKLTIGGQEVFMNNVKFVFSYVIILHKERYLVSRLDLSKLIDPVLRPKFIPDAKPFKTVIIDPGHGGRDSGSSNRFGEEKDYTLTLAKLLKKNLEERRFKVTLTRDADRYLSLNDRVKIANDIPDAIFISIHFGSGGRGRVQGIQTYTLSPVGVAAVGRGLRAGDFNARAGNAHDSANIALATALHSDCLLKTGRPDRGIRRARFSVLTGVNHPAILLEAGFMSHPVEARLINDPVYQKTLSASIADGVVRYQKARHLKR